MEYETLRKMQVHIKFIELDLLSQREDILVLFIAFSKVTKACVCEALTHSLSKHVLLNIKAFVNTTEKCYLHVVLFLFFFYFSFFMRNLNILS